MKKLETLLLPIGNKLSANKYLNSINRGFMIILPITLFGSIFTLIGSLPIKAYTDFLAANGLSAILAVPGKITVDMIAIYAVVAIGYSYAKREDLNAIPVGVASLLNFLILTPLGKVTVDEKLLTFVSFDWIGAKGLFVAMFTGLITARIFQIFIKNDWTLKLPDGVPPMVAASFNALVPIIAISTLFLGISFAFTFTPFGNIHQLIYKVVQTPLTALGTNLVAVLIFELAMGLLWWFGLHGGNIVGSITTPLFLPLGVENLTAYQAGEALPHIYTNVFRNVYIYSGTGATLAFTLLMVFVAKSQQYKTLGRIAAPANLFFINEPVLFGVPIVLNPIMFIPFLVAPLVNIALAYTLTMFGILPRLISYQLPWTTPLFFSGLMQGGWIVAFFQLFLLVLDGLIYYPFFKVLDKQAAESEVVVKETI